MKHDTPYLCKHCLLPIRNRPELVIAGGFTYHAACYRWTSAPPARRVYDDSAPSTASTVELFDTTTSSTPDQARDAAPQTFASGGGGDGSGGGSYGSWDSGSDSSSSSSSDSGSSSGGD